MGDATVINMDAWERDFRINVTSMVMMSKYAIPEMRKQGRGSIVNMSSVSGCKFNPNTLIHKICMAVFNLWMKKAPYTIHRNTHKKGLLIQE